MNSKYIILDIETCPIDLKNYFTKTDDEKLKLLNPIDSKIVAIGLKYENNYYIFNSDNEKELLNNFWEKWKEIKQGSPLIPVIGFNIEQFDIPFIVTRSFINGNKIQKFSLKEIIDLRNKIHAYKYGKTRGKLKEIAELLGYNILDIDGSKVADLYNSKKKEEIKKYLIKDLEITDKIYQRAVDTNIIQISKY
jgi:DNA polymerase elongation subunit (family B)